MIRCLLTLWLSLLIDEETAAHPLGNNTVNRQSAIIVSPYELTLTYRLDLAEIPTLAEGIAADADGDGQTSEAEWQSWADRRIVDIGERLELSLDGRAMELRAEGLEWHLAAGSAGLSVLALRAQYRAALNTPAMRVSLRYRDAYDADRPGWKEIWITASDGAVIDSASVPGWDRSHGLTEFNLPLGAGAPQELSATAELSFAGETMRGANHSDAGEPAAAQSSASDGIPSAVHSGRWPEAWAFFRLGMHHIAVGYDHLAFLLGLLLLSAGLRDMAKVITAFTLAHSTTLGLAANGWVSAPGAVIEPAIALTIVYVGAVGVWRWRREHGVWLAFGFGLVHGFGFAGALAETLASRPGAHWLMDLASFNLGIETLQLLLVGLAFPLLRFAGRCPWGLRLERTASLSVMAAGLGWFVLRVTGE